MIVEYHKFGPKPDKYIWSRTFTQFEKDLELIKEYNHQIRMDDGHLSQALACFLAEKKGLQVYLGITVDYVGKYGYFTWQDIIELSRKHIICNHSVHHEHLDKKSDSEIYKELSEANYLIVS